MNPKMHSQLDQANNSHLPRDHNQATQYKCGLCFMSFSTQEELLQHLRTEHWSNNAKKAQETPKFEYTGAIPKKEPERCKVKIIKEEDILKNEQEMSKKMIFSTRAVLKPPQEASGPSLVGVKREEPKSLASMPHAYPGRPSKRRIIGSGAAGSTGRAVVKKEEPISDEVTRASTQKEKKTGDSAEMTPVKLNDRSQRSSRRTTPSSPYAVVVATVSNPHPSPPPLLSILFIFLVKIQFFINSSILCLILKFVL